MILINQDQAASIKESLGTDTLKELVEIYTTCAQNTLKEISQHIVTGDYAMLKVAAHTLKGSSATFGAQGMQMLAKQIEGFALENNMVALNDCYRGMEEILPETITALYQAYGI
jgi:HPt (histidine-containing phosphotransfer) domain-containing protein